MARRRRTSTLDDLLAISFKLPLWANLVVAATTFGALRYFGGSEFPAMETVNADRLADALAVQVLTVAAYVGQYIVPPIFFIGGTLGWLRRKGRERKFRKISQHSHSGQAIRGLSWQQFEQMVGESFRRKGFSVQETEEGADGGVDLVLNKGSELFLVQCKQWKAAKVGVQVVRELYGVMSACGAAGGFVVTSGSFTPDAFKFARGTSVQLIDGAALALMVKAGRDERIPTATFPAAGAPKHSNEPSNSPTSIAVEPGAEQRSDSSLEDAQRLPCPRCGGLMTPRVGRKQTGDLQDRVFLGCMKFPSCRGTRQLFRPPASTRI
ncbi:restriction endonuclease [Pseudomonas aeruginosa]|uniref:restriction endonuclease n=1 Tax=Pseudomonas aeruginosa TaxID=287 RepID=UPI00071B4654|nr:restriction endonuclease [Pseudomonas aeruginosa]KSQ21593.1 restriction endonuclease [Pseudomonas aeruginosa]RPV61262.1 restriction endonuclease [Pseudomonas aeruginosa]